MHPNAVHDMLSTMTVGIIRGSYEGGLRKRAQKENKEIQYIKDDHGPRIVEASNQVTKISEPVATVGAT